MRIDEPGAQARPNVRQVREHVQPEVERRSTTLGLLVFLAATALYVFAIYGVFAAPYWPLQIVSGILAGFFIGTMFITGHDACHGSLTRSETLNRIVGRIAFLPSLTPYTTWDYAHNRIHHSYTNLRGKDYVWAPFSKEEYDALPFYRRALEHLYRTIFGFSFHYMAEYWWKHLLFLPAEERRDIRQQGMMRFDFLLVGLFLTAQICLAVAVSQMLTPEAGFWSRMTSPWALIVLSIGVPFYNWCWSMNFCIFQHHNHPRIAWYKDRDEWDFFAANVEGTVHMEFPRLLSWITASIMEHTAHHVNSKVPLYHLHTAQEKLEAAYQEHIIVDQWSCTRLIKIMSICKLYDYDNHCWLNFAGKPTTEHNPLVKRYREIRAQQAAFDAAHGPQVRIPVRAIVGEGPLAKPIQKIGDVK